MKPNSKYLTALGLLITLSTGPAQAAQVIEEIVVTATKRYWKASRTFRYPSVSCPAK